MERPSVDMATVRWEEESERVFQAALSYHSLHRNSHFSKQLVGPDVAEVVVLALDKNVSVVAVVDIHGENLVKKRRE